MSIVEDVDIGGFLSRGAKYRGADLFWGKMAAGSERRGGEGAVSPR